MISQVHWPRIFAEFWVGWSITVKMRENMIFYATWDHRKRHTCNSHMIWLISYWYIKKGLLKSIDSKDYTRQELCTWELALGQKPSKFMMRFPIQQVGNRIKSRRQFPRPFQILYKQYKNIARLPAANFDGISYVEYRKIVCEGFFVSRPFLKCAVLVRWRYILSNR